MRDDYNLHHPVWDSKIETISKEAREFVEWTHELDISLCSNRDEPTRNAYVIDLIYASGDIAQFITQETIPELERFSSDHNTIEKIDELTEDLEIVIMWVIEFSIAALKMTNKSKSYSNKDFRESLKEMLQLKIRDARNEEWNIYLAQLRGHIIWKAQKFLKPKSTNKLFPQLKKDDDTITENPDEARKCLKEGFFPNVNQGEEENDQQWPPLTDTEISEAIQSFPDKKSPRIRRNIKPLSKISPECQRPHVSMFEYLLINN